MPKSKNEDRQEQRLLQVNVGRGRRNERYAKPKKDETLRLVFDNGNNQIKAMVDKHFGREIVMPHRVLEISENEFEEYKQKSKYKRTQFTGTTIFGYKIDNDVRYFIVGKQAEDLNRGNRITGAEKYTQEHFGAICVSNMLQLYPDGHPDVSATVLHPSSVTSNNLNDLVSSVGGAHKVIRLDGEKVKYKVRGVVTLEEAVGGLHSFLLTTDSTHSQKLPIDITGDMEILVLDVGGWITTIAGVSITTEGEVEVSVSAPSIQAGIANVIEKLNQELKYAVSPLGRTERIPTRIINEALSSDKVTIRGSEEYDVAEAVEKSMGELGSQIKGLYQSRFSSGVSYDAVIVTGGGGGVAFEYLKNRVLDHPHVHPAERELNRMQFSNVRGASKGWV